MAKKKSTGSSLTALQRTAKSLRTKIAAQNKKKREAARAAKLKKTVDSLRNKLKTTTKRAAKKR